MTTDIIPIAEAAGLRVGEAVNINFLSGAKCDMTHVLTYVGIKSHHGKQWLSLEWTPGESTPWGTASCGHAGYLIDDELRLVLKARAEQ